MPLQGSVELQNAQNNQFEIVGGASPRLRFYTGAKPANCAAAATGTQLAEAILPADWMADSIAGVKALSGVWEDLAADAAGVIGYVRWYKADGVTCFAQGEVTMGGGGGVIDLVNTNVAIGQRIVINSFNLSSANA